MNINGSAASPISQGDGTLGRRYDASEVRRRNRRVAIILAVVFVALVAICAAYIAFLGGSNKPPMKPFHVGLVIAESPRTV